MPEINTLKDLLKDWAPPVSHQPALPAPTQTPRPERNKVVSRPVRQPINRQAAYVTAPNRSWITQPLPPEKLPNPHQKELDALKAELKIERNAHAETRDALGQTNERLRKLKATTVRLSIQIDELRQEIREKDNIIQQLENLKL